MRFLNFGVGGDLAYHAAARVEAVAKSHPEKVIILIGGNDVLSRVFPSLRRFLGAWKRFPQEPSSAWYEESLRRIVTTLGRQTRARIALCSLAPIGEDPHSPNPVQQTLNALVDEYSGIVKRIAGEEHATYIPFYEAMTEAIRGAPGQREFLSDR